MSIRPELRIFDISYFLVPIGTRKSYLRWKEDGVTMSQKFLEVFIFGFRVARFQIGDVG